MAIGAESSALDAAAGTCPSTDERGGERPAGIACDIGAYESGANVDSIFSNGFDSVPARAPVSLVDW